MVKKISIWETCHDGERGIGGIKETTALLHEYGDRHEICVKLRKLNDKLFRTGNNIYVKKFSSNTFLVDYNIDGVIFN